MLKFWNADTGREIKSMGGHSGTITSVLLVPKENNGMFSVVDERKDWIEQPVVLALSFLKPANFDRRQID